MRSARIILADCPWTFRNRHAVRHDGGKTKFGIGVAARYSVGVMSTDEIAALPVAAICAPDAYLFLWTTWTHLPDALRVISAWEFAYKTVAFVWSKTYPGGRPFCGPGRYVPANTEPVLFATRGRPWHPNTGSKPQQVVVAPHPRDDRGKIIHSRKPAEVQERLEAWLTPHIGDGAMVELFATQDRAGWLCLGWDVTGRDLREDLAAMVARIGGAQMALPVEVTT